MNREVGYVVRGFLLKPVVLAGLGIVHFLASSLAFRPSADKIPRLASMSRSQTNSIDIPAVLNERGKWLFVENCNSCHKPQLDCDVMHLATVEQRVRDKALLRGWIRNSDFVLKAGEPYFTKLYDIWGRAPMPVFPHLSDADIDEILEYIWRHRR